MKIGLKIDVDSTYGASKGIINIKRILEKHNASATFMLSLGPYHTKRGLLKSFHIGELSRARHLLPFTPSVGSIFYTAIIPAPRLSKENIRVFRNLPNDGHEVGMHSFDSASWRQKAKNASPEWTKQQIDMAARQYEDIFHKPATTSSVAEWQINAQSLRQNQQLGLNYSSDTRGTSPFIPILNAEIIACPQIPTTLPTVDELLNSGYSKHNYAFEKLASITEKPTRFGHVYSLNANWEGGKLSGFFDNLLTRWKSQGYELVSLHKISQSVIMKNLPKHRIVSGYYAGRARQLFTQGPEFLIKNKTEKINEEKNGDKFNRTDGTEF